ncbi:hypothetical protein [Demetria terragena]|uniref:hypothetical protein n=1 Tax=Demetria terragena TaxID=63959 RepID=UPI00035FB513|nr:hypothetical protein [Demetria terragena]
MIASCISASSKVNGAIRAWNTAVSSGSSTQRDNAAGLLGRTAADLRTMASKSTNKGFTSRTRAVANEMDDMKGSHDNNKSVDSGGLNSTYRTLRTWCTDQIKP